MNLKTLESHRSALIAENKKLSAQKQFYLVRKHNNLAAATQEQIDINNQTIASFDRRIENEFNFN